MRRLAAGHAAGHLLCKEEGAAQVDAHHMVPGVGRQVQKVAAHLCGHACVRHEAGDGAEVGFDPVHQPGRGSGIGHVMRIVARVGQPRQALAHGGGVGGRQRGDGDAEACGLQGTGDRKADALLAAGDQGDRGGHGRPPICAPARSASAAMVSEGLTAAEVGRTEASTI